MSTYKQPVVGTRAVITTNHPEASAAGLEMLAMGGNAIDAAVAALFSLSVVEPMMVSPMGAGFFVIRHGASGEVTTLDNYSTAPAAAKADMFEPVPGSLENEAVDRLNDVGHLAVGTPGALAGWLRVLDNYGRLSRAEVIAPAIRQARRGFFVSPYLAFCIDAEQESLARFPASAEIFLPGGNPPAVGDRIVRGDYAQTLERIAENGLDEFVTGQTADAILAEMERGGGVLTRDDLAGYELKDREPVRGSYRGFEIAALGPVSSGSTHIVQMLRILEGYDLASYGFGSVERVHLVAEALKVAFADRFRYMADPAQVDIPVGMLTSAAYADQRRAEIGDANGSARQYQAGEFGDLGESNCTTHLNVADADGRRGFRNPDAQLTVRIARDGNRHRFAAQQHHAQSRSGSGTDQFDCAGQAHPEFDVADDRAERWSAGAGDRYAGRAPHFRGGAAGHHECDRFRDAGPGSGRGSTHLDDGTDPGNRGHLSRSRERRQRTRAAGTSCFRGREDCRRHERDRARPGVGRDDRCRLLAR
ncbi:MAG: gamma-glutamyltransferase [Thermomicrobiales bacterium]